MKHFTLLCCTLPFVLSLPSCHTPRQEGAARHAQPTKTVVVDSLRHPWSMAFITEDSVLVAEKDGGLVIVDLPTKRKTPVRGFPGDLADSIRIKDPRDNSGIFEVLPHPGFAANRWLYVSYAAQGPGGTTTKIIRGTLRHDSLANTKTLLLASPFTPDLFHYGGGMVFGPDGKLYATVGERLYNEMDEPPLPIAQDANDPRGTIFRLNDDGTIPEDNPVQGQAVVPGTYAIGIRAAQGLAVNPVTGSIWFSEHGTHQGDELNVLKAGANYGWPIITTGRYRSEKYVPPTMENLDFTDPVWYWEHTVAPTGLCFYTGREFPQWQNSLLVPGLGKGSLWRFEVAKDSVLRGETLFDDDPVRLRKVALSPGGKLYLLTDEANGKVVLVGNRAQTGAAR